MGMSGYIIKWADEAAWAVSIGVAVYVLQVLSETAEVTDWRAYLVALAAGAGRVAAALLLNEVRKLRGGQT
jgi:hypothetical protein